jgi:hypothetical protein
MENLSISNTEAGVMLEVRVMPNSSKNIVDSVYNGKLKIRINAAPEDGKANKELISFLAKKLGIKKSQIEVTRGATSQDKTLLISGVGVDAVKALL